MDDNKSEKQERSYLSAAVETFSPWGNSRSSTPKLASVVAPGEGSGLRNQQGKDHMTQCHGLSLKRYPDDCPKLDARWFYAVDVPKRKPTLLKSAPEDNKPASQPKKFVSFSAHDSRAIEAAYQTLLEGYENSARDMGCKESDILDAGVRRPVASAWKKSSTMTMAGLIGEKAAEKVRVPVHEDFLFEVDIEERELSPVYWLGPIYEVRRGSWFFQEGSALRACDENLAAQLEEGYLKVKPFRYPQEPEKAASRPTSLKLGEDNQTLAFHDTPPGRIRTDSGQATPRASMENLKLANKQALADASNGFNDAPAPRPHQPQTYRLFGAYMNSIVTYQDSTVAWLSADSIMSRVSSTVYQKFAGGGYLGGLKLVRGYSEPGKSKDAAPSDRNPTTPVGTASRDMETPFAPRIDERQKKLLKRRSAPPTTSRPEIEAVRDSTETALSSLTGEISKESEAETIRKRDETEIQNDYSDSDGENQGRQVEHLILVTHGIGQRLGMRTESVNFIHDVNVLRQTLKSVYSSSSDLQALNSEIDKLPKNCRIQVLPVCWRHLLDFPKKGVRQNRREHDLGDVFGDEEDYPNLEDITVEGVPFVRSLITDLALDILLYQSAYREHICDIVLAEANRIYNLFRERNHDFNGKVSLVGHSLGSAILFDILCRQRENSKLHKSATHDTHSKHRPLPNPTAQRKDLEFDFDVEDFYCLGSPIGLFQMLKGRNILARHYREDAITAESPMDPDYGQDPFLATTSKVEFASGHNISSVTGLPLTISSPKVTQLYNIFHPSDPISYRLEPLIAPAMSSMKPQLLPYTKKTISASVTGIGAKVGQSVTGLWSSLSSGIASSLLNRSLGLTNDDVARMETPVHTQTRSASQSLGAGTNISAGGVIHDVPSLQRENTNEKKRQLAKDMAAADRDGTGAHAPTLIDDEIETLYSGFQKRRKSHQSDTAADQDWLEAEERGKKLRLEEMKVRALNANGRVDYSIQESVLDFNPINTIASHLSYWADEDVNHFIMSQLLSRHRTLTKTQKPVPNKERD